jgi:hypothetical protein
MQLWDGTLRLRNTNVKRFLHVSCQILGNAPIIHGSQRPFALWQKGVVMWGGAREDAIAMLSMRRTRHRSVSVRSSGERRRIFAY